MSSGKGRVLSCSRNRDSDVVSRRRYIGKMLIATAMFGSLFLLCAQYSVRRVSQMTSNLQSLNSGSQTVRNIKESDLASGNLSLIYAPHELPPSTNVYVEELRNRVRRLQCLQDIRYHLMNKFEPYFRNAKKVALIDVALHSNIGDSILWRSAIHLATLFGKSLHYICTTSQIGGRGTDIFPKCSVNRTMSVLKEGGLVLYQGGGNWGDSYRHVQDFRMEYLSSLNSESMKEKDMQLQVVSLPQTITYASTKSDGFKKDVSVMGQMQKGFLSIFVREQPGYDLAKRYYSQNVNIELTPDLAFILGPLSPIGIPDVDVLFLIRTDSEIKSSDKWRLKEIERQFNNTGFTFLKEDWNWIGPVSGFSHKAPTIVSEVSLNKAIKQISKGRVVVTNRLHASIIANLIDKPLFWFDTNDGKLQQARRVAFRVSPFCSSESLISYRKDSLLSASKAAIDYLMSHIARDIKL